MASVWGDAWGSAWGVSWGQAATVAARPSAGGGRIWAPEPERPLPRKKEKKREYIEWVTNHPLPDINLGTLTALTEQVLSQEVPDWRAIVEAAKRAEDERIRRKVRALQLAQAEREAAEMAERARAEMQRAKEFVERQAQLMKMRTEKRIERKKYMKEIIIKGLLH